MYLTRTGSLLALLCLASHFMAHSQSGPAASLPNDPKDLFSLISDRNGLESSDVKPWHIRGHFTIYNKDGKPEDQGTYEEWWVRPNKYKRSFTTAKFTQTDYANGGVLFREGLQDWSGVETGMRSALITPIPEMLQSDFALKEQEQRVEKLKLKCVSLTYALQNGPVMTGNVFPTYCVDPALAVLRLSSTGTPFGTVYNRFTLFQGRYVAQEIRFAIFDKPAFDLSLDTVETMAQPAENFPNPPQDAKPVDLAAISFPLDQARFGAVKLLKKASPIYPLSAKEQRIQGEIALKATIGTNGHIVKMTVTSGPQPLQQAAIDAVSQWVYQPFVVMGQARQIVVDIKVIFTLG